MTPRTLLCAVFFAVGLLVQGQADAAGDVVIQRFGAAPNGMGPFTPLVADASGNLYGAAAQGGKYGQGVVYELSPPTATVATWTHRVLYSFPPSSGIGQSQGALVQGPKGVLYGTASTLGDNPGCAIFQLTPPATGSTGWTETELYNFSGADGGACAGAMIGGAGGVLYGTLPSGGTTRNGAIFELAPPKSPSVSWTMSTIYAFSACTPSTTAAPTGNLVVSPSGVLYGTVNSCNQTGVAAVFELTPPASGQTAWTESEIYSYTAESYDVSTLSIGSNGVLYGTLPIGCCGVYTLYSLTPPASGQTNWNVSFYIYEGGFGGGNVVAALVPGAGGSLYGTTTSGGTYGFGTAFQFFPPAAGQTQGRAIALHSFNGVDGGFVNTSLVKGRGGVLYGVASEGGASGNGTVFSLVASSAAKSGWIETTLYEFSGAAAEVPNAALVGDGTGALYGTTAGSDGMASVTVFKLTPPAAGQTDWGYQQIYTFMNGPDATEPYGALPQSPLIIGHDGSIYGAIPTNSQSIFKLTPPAQGATNWTETTIGTLVSSGDPYNNRGPSPITSLVQATNGTLYGAADVYGESYVFSLSPPTSNGGNWDLQDIYNLDNSYITLLSLTVRSNGNLLVTTNILIGETGGTIFELKPPAMGQGPYWTQTNLYSFTNGATNGDELAGPLLPGPDGVLYGTTLAAGGAYHESNGYGTVFALTPPASGQTAWTYNVLYSFGGGLDGAAPQSNLLLGEDGALYGITSFGGETASSDGGLIDTGTVYKLTPPKKTGGIWTHHVLHRFSGGRDGLYPFTGLMLNSDGKLYGTTPSGGGYGSGYVVNFGPPAGQALLPGSGTVFQIIP